MTTTRNERILQRIKEMGLTERAAALKAGLNARFITDLLLNPKMSPRAENLRKLAEALETTSDWLDRGIDTARVDETTAELIRIMPRLNQRARQRIVEIAKLEAKLANDTK